MGEDRVRVIRVLEYYGPRDWVQSTLDKSAVQAKESFGNGLIEELARSKMEVLRTEPIDEALEGSIRKWEKIVNGTGADDGWHNCPLCDKHNQPGVYCDGCIVQENRTSPLKGCSGTPYAQWDAHHHKAHHGRMPKRVECRECKRLAQDELDFLISLRKEVK